MNKSWSILFFVVFTFFLWNCASHGLLTGGDEDTQAPIMDTLNSTKNYQTNFYPEKIELVFDEFIQLKNPLKEIGISPPLSNIAQYQVRGKTLTIDLPKDEVLRENATYTFNFGNSIQDYRESNVLEDFTFVFATGDVLDSLRSNGKVTNASDGQPVENAVVLVYDNLEDSIVYNEKPFYFDKTDKDGIFKIDNIKNDTFQIFAITDQNLSYTWDPKTEAIAFANESFVLTDSFKQDFNFTLSSPFLEAQVIEVVTRKDGLIKCSFTSAPEKSPAFTFSKEIEYDSYLNQDSLFIWYDTINNPSFSMYMLNDTFKVKPKRSKRKTPFKIKLDKQRSANQIIPKDTLSLYFNYPILEMIEDSIMVSDTSNTKLDYQLSLSDDRQSINIETDRKTNIPYKIIFQDSCLKSYNGVYNDSIGFEATYLKLEELSTIHLLRDSIISDLSYVLILLDGNKEIQSLTMPPDLKKISIPQLIPKNYSLKIIEDKNKNGKWDPADFSIRSQPERQAMKDLGKLKENWELEVEISSKLFNKLEPDDSTRR